MFLGKYTRLIFIGDSNSDNGNVQRMTKGTWPTPGDVYVDGRYSNGQMWVDHLERLSGCSRTLNLAYGCATIDNNIVSGTVPVPQSGSDAREREEVPGVIDQVEQLRTMVAGQRLAPGDIVFVQAGSNDLNSLIAGSPAYLIKHEFTPALLARRLRAAVHTLYSELGACRVVVLNVRPREDYPCVLALNDPQVLEHTHRITRELNDAISQEMVGLQNALGASARISVFDAFGFQKQITADPAAFGIDPDVATPCFDESRTGGTRLLNPDSQLFVDGAHLAKRAQALLAADMIKHLALQE
ncbi:hypothetical protein EV175_005684, partial [Coemansia sp. RSA 1933]